MDILQFVKRKYVKLVVSNWQEIKKKFASCNYKTEKVQNTFAQTYCQLYKIGQKSVWLQLYRYQWRTTEAPPSEYL